MPNINIFTFRNIIDYRGDLFYLEMTKLAPFLLFKFVSLKSGFELRTLRRLLTFPPLFNFSFSDCLLLLLALVRGKIVGQSPVQI